MSDSHISVPKMWPGHPPEEGCPTCAALKPLTNDWGAVACHDPWHDPTPCPVCGSEEPRCGDGCAVESSDG